MSGVCSLSRATSAWLAVRAEVTWNGRGRPSGYRAAASPSSTASLTHSERAAATISGTRLVMSSRVRVNTRTSGAGPVHLDPDAVDLPLHRGGRDPLQRGGQRGRGGGQHGLERPSDLEGDGQQRPLGGRGVVRGRAERGYGGLGQRAADLVGPADRGRRHSGRGGDGLGHDPAQRPLAQVAGQQPDQELPFVLGGLGQQLAQELAPVGLRAGTGQRADGPEGRVGLGQRQLGDRGGRRQARS